MNKTETSFDILLAFASKGWQKCDSEITLLLAGLQIKFLQIMD